MLNKAQIIGHLGQDPDIRYTPSNLAVARLSVATNENKKDQNGEKPQFTEWHRVVLFGKVADIAAEHLKKGSLAYLEGRLKTRKWQADDVTDRYTTEIIADQLRMLGRRSGQENAVAAPQAQPSQRQAPASARGWDPADAQTDFDDDIPF